MKMVKARTFAAALGVLMGAAAVGFSPKPAAAQCQEFPKCDMCTHDFNTGETKCTNCTFSCEPQ